MKREIALVNPRELTDVDRASYLEVIREGSAVDLDSAATELPLALLLAVARVGSAVVGVAAIKRARPDYAAKIAQRSGFRFDVNLPELGYVAVREAHRGKGIGGALVARLLAGHGKKPLFATTSHPGMMKHLARARFGRFGNAWTGHKADLALWIRK